ncbi:hypothetical protein QR680_017373 [Steinernema hermaphroditum]|uniref:Uncharacterized protein n=1 Tax=Steinernema hermaphroditum TaxID=289476 RepID=A0AA39LNI9_9BILA|nr:hypothetical protein QR680_017373 [Steinernema hermaphroditum]
MIEVDEDQNTRSKELSAERPSSFQSTYSTGRPKGKRKAEPVQEAFLSAIDRVAQHSEDTPESSIGKYITNTLKAVKEKNPKLAALKKMDLFEVCHKYDLLCIE